MTTPTSCLALKLLVVTFFGNEDDMKSGDEKPLVVTASSHKEVTALSQGCGPRGQGTAGETKRGSEGCEYLQLGRKLLFPPNCIYSRPESEGVQPN